ncbi:MAG: DHH family phosphoesterase [Muribaculaceae bacterium]|nr:DHH family phosphoesterase [Muribaculaceae bacterium]
MIRRIIDQGPIARIKQLLEHASKVAITCHISPDGDALGSSLALCHVLMNMGIDAKVITPDSVSANLQFLPGAKDIVDGNRYSDYARTLFCDADVVFCLDFNARNRIDRLASALNASKAPKVLIDHHLDPEDFADVTVSHPEMSSTCMLLFRVLCRLELFDLIDKTAAELILAGMMTDTGNFSYNASDPEIYIIVSELLKKGANKEMLYKRLFNTFSESSLRINGYALSQKMELFPEEHAALITLSREELNRFHYSKGDTEALVNRPLAIPGVIYSCFLREEDGYVKVSMRSVGDFPVDKLCNEYFSGGGHRNAAGGEYPGTLDECAELFRSLLKRNRELYIEKSPAKI